MRNQRDSTAEELSKLQERLHELSPDDAEYERVFDRVQTLIDKTGLADEPAGE